MISVMQLEKDIMIFMSYHTKEATRVVAIAEQLRMEGWSNILIERPINVNVATEHIRRSSMVLVCLSHSYISDDNFILSEFALAATIERRPFLLVWL
jgi:hypothetical protein